MLEGPIVVGDRLIWEPREPTAYERITVVAVHRNTDDETWIQAEGRRGRYWNTEERTREACIRDVAQRAMEGT